MLSNTPLQTALMSRRAAMAGAIAAFAGACQSGPGGAAQIVTFSHWFLAAAQYDPVTTSNELSSGARSFASLGDRAPKCSYLASFAPGEGLGEPNRFQLSLFGSPGQPPSALQLIGEQVANLSTEDACAVQSGATLPDRLATGLELSSPQSITMNADFAPSSISVFLNGVGFSGNSLYRRARLTTFNQTTRLSAGEFEFLATSSTQPQWLVVVEGSFSMTGRYFTG